MKKHTYLDPMSATDFAERFLLGLLMQAMYAAGWRLLKITTVGIGGYPQHYQVKDADAVAAHTWAWKRVNEIDGVSYVHFNQLDGISAWVMVVSGNGQDFLSNYTTNIGDEIIEKVFLQ